MFSFVRSENALPIAMVKGGKKDGKIIYLYKEEDDAPEDATNEIMIDDSASKVFPIPNMDKRECLLVAGPSGSGKSVYSAGYMKLFRKMYPKAPIYIFSRLSEDEPLDEIKNTTRVILDDEFIKAELKWEHLRGDAEVCLVLFDDVNTIYDKQIKLELNKLMKDILETARKGKVYCIITNHMINNSQETKVFHNESTSTTFFPRGSSAYHIKYFLEHYGGLSKADIKKVYSIKSRHFTLYKEYPPFMLHEKGVFAVGT